MVRLLLFLVLASAAAVAGAGTRATYVSADGFRRTIAIADNGDIDVELVMGQHLIVQNGRAFIVEAQLTGPFVTPLDELTATIEALARSAMPQPGSPEEAAMLEDIASLAGDQPLPSDETQSRPEINWRPRSRVEMGSRSTAGPAGAIIIRVASMATSRNFSRY